MLDTSILLFDDKCARVALQAMDEAVGLDNLHERGLDKLIVSGMRYTSIYGCFRKEKKGFPTRVHSSIIIRQT